MVAAKSLIHFLLASSPPQETSIELGTRVKRQASTTANASLPRDTICGDIIEYANQNLSTNWVFNASKVHECYLSVPFIDAVALRFLDYIDTTYQFQSTLSYLRNPPAGYQQPAIDFEQELQQIRQNVTAGFFHNQYDFEATVQTLFQRVHDSHVNINAGLLSAFTFGSGYDLVSVSVDGKQPPKVYFLENVTDYQPGTPVPPAITAINGRDVVEYLTDFASYQSEGLLEPHADWNNLFYNPVEDILGYFNLFGWEAALYPGDDTNADNLTFVLEDQSVVDSNYWAFYLNPDQTGPLTTGGDFYNYFVLGFPPASYVPPNDTEIEDEWSLFTPLLSWNTVVPAFPATANVVSPDLSIAGSGVLTGYFYEDISTAVLSIPSFTSSGDAFDSFMNTTNQFITQAQQAGMIKVVIDLQQNTGGETLLAFNTFALFFPNIEPFAGSRRRSFNPVENVLGASITDYWNVLSTQDASDEWYVTNRLNAATGENFASWSEFYGPVMVNGDNFSLTERYNLSDQTFDDAATGGGTLYPAGSSPPWTSDNIVILTDGMCGSTCALFVEMMHHEAGVRTVVAGGRPTTGPMQATAGSRGASGYYSFDLDDDFFEAEQVNPNANLTLPQVRDPNIFTYQMEFNLRDQIRKQDSTPLQFQYEAADCRIYFTFANVFNLERLWRDAAAAIWTDPSLCVEGSTRYSTTDNSTAAASVPVSVVPTKPFQGFDSNANVSTSGPGLLDPGFDGSARPYQVCNGKSDCQRACQCVKNAVTLRVQSLCLPSCNSDADCGSGHCNFSQRQSEAKHAGGASFKPRFLHGVCLPAGGSKVKC